MSPLTKLISFCILAVPALTMADSTTITFDKAGLGNDYKLSYDHQTENVFVGQLLFSTKTQTSPFVTYCVDLSHLITPGQSYSVDPVQTNTLNSKSPYVLAGDVLDAGLATATDKNHAAALQLAIWSAVYGNHFSVSGVSSTVLGEEKSYLSAGEKYNGNALLFQDAKCSKGQSQITSTPEPTSLAVLGVGAIGIFFRKRRS